MSFESLAKSDIQLALTGLLLLALGVVLAIIAVTIYKKVKDLLAITSKSEKELEEKVKVKTKELSVLHELTTLMSQSLKTEEILSTALRKVIEIAEADIGGIHIIDASGGFLDLILSDKIPTEITMRIKRLKIGEELISAAVQKKAVIGIDVSKYPESNIGALISRHGFRYILSIPIVFKDTALGVITVAYRKLKTSADNEGTFSLLRSIGLAIGVALNNSMLFEKVEQAKKEWESTFDSIKDLVYLCDKDCRIVRCNTAFMDYVRLKPRDIIGKEYFRIFPKTDAPLEACFRGTENGEKTQEEITDGETGRTFLIDMYPVFDKNGKYIYSVHSAKDITEIKQAKKDLEDLLISTITSLVSAIDAKSPWTKGHSERVTYYATKIGQELGLNQTDIETLTLAGLLHDIGKLGTYDAVLDKPDKLTNEEFELVKKHPLKGAEILAPIKQLSDIIPIIKQHHERYDGNGYPSRLKGDEISVSARILCAADSFDAMTAERPYKPAREIEDAKAELKRCSGAQFDPLIVDAFLKVLSGN